MACSFSNFQKNWRGLVVDYGLFRLILDVYGFCTLVSGFLDPFFEALRAGCAVYFYVPAFTGLLNHTLHLTPSHVCV